MFLVVSLCLYGFIYPAFGAAASNNQLIPENVNAERYSRDLHADTNETAQPSVPEDSPSRKFYQEVSVTTIKKSQFKDDLELFTTEYLTKIQQLLRKYHDTHERTVKTRNLNKIVNLLLYYAKKSETGNYWYTKVLNEPNGMSEKYIRDLLYKQWLRKIFIILVQSEFDFDVIQRPFSASEYLENWSEPQDIFTMTKLISTDVSEEPSDTNLLRLDRLTHILQLIKQQERAENDVEKLRVLQKIKKIVALLIIVANGNENWYKELPEHPKDNLQISVRWLLRQKPLYKVLNEVENSDDAFYNKPDLVQFTTSAELPYEVLEVIDSSDVYNSTEDVTSYPVIEENVQGPDTNLQILLSKEYVPDSTKEQVLKVEHLVSILQFIKQQETEEEDTTKLRILEKVKKIISLLILGAGNGDDKWYKDVVEHPKDDLQVHVQRLLKQKWLYDLLHDVDNSKDLQILYNEPKLVALTMRSQIPTDVSKVVETSDVYTDDDSYYDTDNDTDYDTVLSGPVVDTKTDINTDYSEQVSNDIGTNDANVSPVTHHSIDVVTEFYPKNLDDFNAHEQFADDNLAVPPSHTDSNEVYPEISTESESIKVLHLKLQPHYKISALPIDKSNVDYERTPPYDDYIDNNERTTLRPFPIPITEDIKDISSDDSSDNSDISASSPEFATEPTELAERNNQILRVAITQLRQYIKGEHSNLPRTMNFFKVKNLITLLNNLVKSDNRNALHSKLEDVVLELLEAATISPDPDHWYNDVIEHPRTPIENNARSLLLEERLHIIMSGLHNNNYNLSVIDSPPLNAILRSWKLPSLERTGDPNSNRPDEPSPEYLLTATNLLETLKALEQKLVTLPKDKALLNLKNILTQFLISAFNANDKNNWYQEVIENPKDYSEQGVKKTLSEEQFIQVLIDLYKNNNDFKSLLDSELVTYLRNVSIPTVPTNDNLAEQTTETPIYISSPQPENEISTPSYTPTTDEVYNTDFLKRTRQILETSENVKMPLHLKQKLQYIIDILLTVANKPNSDHDWYTKTLNNPEDDLDEYAQLLLKQKWLRKFFIELQDTSFDVKSLKNLILVQRLQAWHFPKHVIKIVPPTSRVIGIRIVHGRDGNEMETDSSKTPIQTDIQFIIDTLKTDVDQKATNRLLRHKLHLLLYTKRALQKIAIYLKTKGYSNKTIAELIRKLNTELKSRRLKIVPFNQGFYKNTEDIIKPLLIASEPHTAHIA